MAAPAPIDDPSSPYHLHHSDHPRLVLVSQPLNGDNYSSWHRSMEIALSTKNKFGFLNGSIPYPGDNEDPTLLSAWNRNNRFLMSWILNCVSKEIITSMIYDNTATEIWSDLKTHFQQ